MVYARVPRHFTLARKLLWVMKGGMPSKVQKPHGQLAAALSLQAVSGRQAHHLARVLVCPRGAFAALRLERVELLLEPFLGGFAGVDHAPDAGLPADHQP